MNNKKLFLDEFLKLIDLPTIIRVKNKTILFSRIIVKNKIFYKRSKIIKIVFKT